MKYKEGYDWGKQSLETAGVSEAELDARLLLEKICGTDRNTLLVHGGRLLSEEETDIYKRGRNANGHHVPKNADPVEYRRATGLEALFGYLYLKGEQARIRFLFDHIWEHLE